MNMQEVEAQMTPKRCRKNERGAALVMVLLISFLLLVALSALIMEATMNTANVTDATAEEQAYYAAESGIQSVIDALRHNPVPVPLIDPAASPTPPNPDAALINVIDYRKAVERRFSNATCDPSDVTPPTNCTAGFDSAPTPPRMSRWIRYNWGPNGGTADPNPDRVVLGDPALYSPINGFAYSLAVTDPDDTTGTVTYTATGGIEPAVAGPLVASRIFTGAGGTTEIRYVPPAGAQTVNVETGTGNGGIGRFEMVTTGSGGDIPPLNYDPAVVGMTLPATFKITLTFSQPQNMRVVIRGYISPAGTPLLSDPLIPSSCARTGVSYLFDSQNFINFGSRQTLRLAGNATPSGGGCMVEERDPTHSGPYGTYLTGWMVPAAASVPLTMDITQPEPTRLLVRSTGYGPRGARKELESIVQKNYFDGLGAPSPLTLIGPTCTRWSVVNCTVVPTALPVVTNITQPTRDFFFEPGTSNVVIYSGKDQLLRVFQPPIGATNDPNVSRLLQAITSSGFNGEVHGRVANIKDELPFWLQNPANLDRVVRQLRETAKASGTYWGPASNPPQSGVYGDWNTGTGITFVDRDVRISQDGGGILVVTGRLELRGGYRFKGVIILTGAGGLYRSGGGGGVESILAGNMIVAPYTRDNPDTPAIEGWSLATCMPDNINYPDKIDCFLPPRYEISGGGGSDTMGNSQVVGKGLNGLGNFVKGVAEK